MDIAANLHVIPDVSFVTKFDDLENLVDYAIRTYSSPIKKPILLDREVFLGVQRDLYVADCLRIALAEKKWLEVYFQPIYSLAEQRFTSAEALLRLHHPDGSISPVEFIPVAERAGIINYINTYVIESVSDFMRERNLNLLNIQRININLSGKVFSDREIFSDLLEVIRSNRVRPELVCFEVTEAVGGGNVGLFESRMDMLHRMGFLFALDDFGTGFSNISRMLSLPFDIVKIDKGILDSSKKVFFDTLSLLSHANCTITVEGVETAEQVEWLKTTNVDCLQGFFFARPMPAGQFVSFLEPQTQSAG